MGKGYNNYMTKKPFHPGSKANIKRTWMAEQRAENEKKKQEELKTQYEKEQDLYNNRALLSTESKDKLELNFMYEAPPGAKRERQKEDDEPEYKFEWQRKYNAPREDYAKGNADIRDQPFGIPVRNVRCIKCHKWGHINTDKECPLYSHASTSSMPTTSMDPLELMRQMREDGYNLKQNVLGHCVNPKSANQQLIPSDESDPEMDFLKSLTSKQKHKLLKKLNKLSKKKKEESKKKKKKDKLKRKSGASTSESEEKSKQKKKKSKTKEESSSSESESDSSDEDSSRLVSEKPRKASDRKQAKQNVAGEKLYKHKKKLPDNSSLSSDSSDESPKKKVSEKKKSSSQSSSSYAECSKKRRKARHDDSSDSNSEHEGESPVPKRAKNSKDKPKDKGKSHSDTKQEKKKHKGDSEASSKDDENTTKQTATEKSTKEAPTEETKEKISQPQHSASVKSPNSDQKRKNTEEDPSPTKKDKSPKEDELKDKVRTHVHSSSEDSSSEKCQQKSQSTVKAEKSSKSKDSGGKHIVGEEETSLSSTSKSQASPVKCGENVHEDSPMHPDGFDHEYPQRNTGEENTSLIAKYEGMNHDRFRDLHRHRRSPSVKHKYRS